MTTQELIEKIQRQHREVDSIYINRKTFRKLFADEMERAPEDRLLTTEFDGRNEMGFAGRFAGIPFIIVDEMPDDEVAFHPFFATTINGTWEANTVAVDYADFYDLGTATATTAVNYADFNDWGTATATTANYTTVTTGQYGNLTTDFNRYATVTGTDIYDYIRESFNDWTVRKPVQEQPEELPEISDKDFDEILGMGVA